MGCRVVLLEVGVRADAEIRVEKASVWLRLPDLASMSERVVVCQTPAVVRSRCLPAPRSWS